MSRQEENSMLDIQVHAFCVARSPELLQAVPIFG